MKSDKKSEHKSIKQLFSQFCLKHGVPKQTTTASFEKRLQTKFKDIGKQYLDNVQARAKGEFNGSDLYHIIYSSLEFSNALAGQLDAVRLATFCEWMLEQTGDVSGKLIIDIGCGNGLLTCFLAQQFPNAQIIGIDINMDATLVTDARAIGLKLDNVHTFTGSLSSFLKTGIAKADLIIASQVFADSIEMTVFNNGLLTPDERDIPQSSLKDLTLIKELLADKGLFFSLERWDYSEYFCRWVRICEASGLSFVAHHSKGLIFSNADHQTEICPVGTFIKNLSNSSPARREDVMASYACSKMDICKIEKNEALVDMIFSAWHKIDVYIGKAIFKQYDTTFIIRIGVAGGIGYYYAGNDAGWQILHYGPSVRLKELVSEMKAARKQYKDDGAIISWETFHPDICASLGLDFEISNNNLITNT